MLKLPPAAAELPCVLIDCPSGKFQLNLRQPTYEERLTDEGLVMRSFQPGDEGRSYATQQKRRLEIVVGWHGVVDERGDSVPFTLPALLSLLSLCPDAIDPTMTAVGKLFQGDRKALGKSVPPPAISSEISAGETSPTPSESTSSSSPSTTAAAPSA